MTWKVGSGWSGSTESPDNWLVLARLGKPYLGKQVTTWQVCDSRHAEWGDTEMLALVALFLTTFLIAAAAVWLYRLIFSWKGANHRLVGRPRTTMAMKLSAQQGYITLAPKLKKTSQTPARVVKLRTVRGGVKAPWGW